MLFTFAGGPGHFLPLVPFARAAQAAGHAVAFGAQRDLLTTAPLLEVDMAREVRAVRDGYAGRTARERAPNVRRLCEEWHADVLVCDEMDFGALVAVYFTLGTIFNLESGDLFERTVAGLQEPGVRREAARATRRIGEDVLLAHRSRGATINGPWRPGRT
jgi:UDP:flavonoid glycosyltransferase YjiC (YdhE family)